jgi:hypothetical protein
VLLPDPLVFGVCAVGIFIIAFMKGALGGGFAIAGDGRVVVADGVTPAVRAFWRRCLMA